MTDSIVPECRHGRIILGCPDSACPEQNEYLANMHAALSEREVEQLEAARRLVRESLNLPL